MVRGERDLAAVGSPLGERLRSLREEAGLTQKELAVVLGGEGGTMVSMWETARRFPPDDRLMMYARLFATQRSFSGKGPPRLIDDEDMTEEERRRFEQLERELLGLRDEARRGSDGSRTDPAPTSRVFLFNDGAPITVVCADVPESQRPTYAVPTDLNFVRASAFADLDALLDLFGHLRAENPIEQVRIRASGELKKEEMSGHLVLLGGSVWNEATAWLSDQIGLPLRQETVDAEETLVLVQDQKPRQFRTRRDGNLLREDVGVFVRAPNPQAPQHTITICNGITTRGVRGVVQCFADYQLRWRNEDFMATRFAGRASYGIVVRVEVLPMSGEPLTPDLTRSRTRLYEWANGDTGPGQGSDG
jgi:transcriptional regulator with XRE-family HTH domain